MSKESERQQSFSFSEETKNSTEGDSSNIERTLSGKSQIRSIVNEINQRKKKEETGIANKVISRINHLIG